jgi:predicted kinase
MATFIMICGMAGAGKTTLAKQLERSRRAFRFSPDEWIKAVIQDESNKIELGRLRDPVESLQWRMAQKLLSLEVSVILENGFWGKEERAKFRLEAKALGARVELYYLDLSQEEIWRRIEKRNCVIPDGTFRIERHDLDSWWASFTPPDTEELKSYDEYHIVKDAGYGAAQD